MRGEMKFGKEEETVIDLEFYLFLFLGFFFVDDFYCRQDGVYLEVSVRQLVYFEGFSEGVRVDYLGKFWDYR